MSEPSKTRNVKPEFFRVFDTRTQSRVLQVMCMVFTFRYNIIKEPGTSHSKFVASQF